MTGLIQLTPADLDGLNPLQQHMVRDLAEKLDGVCQLGQATPDQVAEVLRRLVDITERLHEHNRGMAARAK